MSGSRKVNFMRNFTGMKWKSYGTVTRVNEETKLFRCDFLN